MKKEKVINDLVYFKNLKIVQNKEYFNFSLDSVLLPSFVNISKNTKTIMDFCTGNAPIPIILSTKTRAKIYGIEIQKDIYELARESVQLNNISNIEILNMDIKDLPKMFETDSMDIITCNPPYFKYNNDSILNSSEIKSIARHEIKINLDDIMKVSKKLLKNNGSIYIIHRTERLIDIIESMKKNNIEPKKIQFIYPKEGLNSTLMMIEGRKNANTGLKLLKPLYIHNNDGSYRREVLKIFGKES